jgi:hypothetical protein
MAKAFKHMAHWIVGGVIIGVAFAFVFGFLVMWLWNWLMPALFGLSTITYWQAWGLVVLTHILFKGGHHGHHDRHSPFHRSDCSDTHTHWREHFKSKMKAHMEANCCCEEATSGEPEEEKSSV